MRCLQTMRAVIIGSGISGLCAGAYLQMNGFETEIFEQHSNAGGLCTSWKRGGYTFESGFQWLLGSSPRSPYYQLWSELIDMKRVDFFQHEIRMEIEVKESCDHSGNKRFQLFSNIQRLNDYLLDIAPEDERPIRQLIRTMRKIQNYEIPPAIKKNPGTLTWREKIGFIRYIPLLFFMHRMKRETNRAFASRLKNPFLKEAFQLLFDGEEHPLLLITLPLAFNDLNATAYPIGGATKFVDRLKERYLSLGGAIHFQAPVKRINTSEGVATGIELADGRIINASVIVSTVDWHFTVFKALEEKYLNKAMLKLGELKQFPLFYSIFMVSLGVSKRLNDMPHFLRFPLDEVLISPDGSQYYRMESHIYNYDPTLAPDGKTVVTASLSTRHASYWIDLREKDQPEYLEQKARFAAEIIKQIEKKFPIISGSIEALDIATPATYHRYTLNRQGAVQGWMSEKNLLARIPIASRLPNLRHFYYAGHWTQAGGGLPVAIKSARDMVQDVCHDFRRPFTVTEEGS